MPTGPKRRTPMQERQAFGLTMLHPSHPEVRRLQHNMALAPWAQSLAEQFCANGLSLPARRPPAGPGVGVWLRLGARGHRLRQNVPRPVQRGLPRDPARHLCGPHSSGPRGTNQVEHNVKARLAKARNVA